ncbi:hypothetical protein Hdeb2414_s0003g00103121 [Helianthus debilis subsp. tardiflorus]
MSMVPVRYWFGTGTQYQMLIPRRKTKAMGKMQLRYTIMTKAPVYFLSFFFSFYLFAIDFKTCSHWKCPKHLLFHRIYLHFSLCSYI